MAPASFPHTPILMTTRKTQPSTFDKIIRFIFGILVFSALVSGGTYYLQSSLLFLLSFGLYAHWAVVLILLPALSGLLQHIIGSPARLIVALLGALASTLVLYPLYAEQFWAVPPSMTDAIVFTFAIAGIGFTSSINPFDRHIHQRRTSTHLANPQIESHGEGELAGGFLNSSMIRSFELILTVLSCVLAIWGTFSLGSAQM